MRGILTVLALSTLGMAGAAIAQDIPPDLDDLVGVRGSSGEREMEARGYQFISGSASEDRKYTNWWNDLRGNCVTVMTRNGRYEAITATLPADCDRPGTGTGDYPAPPKNEIHLTCFGEGKRPRISTVPTFRWDRREREFDTDYVNVVTRDDFDSMVQIDIRGHQGYIWLPKSLQPIIHSGGDHGWWQLDDLELEGASIEGRYRLNGLNKPRVEIDLETMRIRIRGQRSFRGQCEQSAP